MRTLRSRVDAVMVGGGTVRAERLSLSLDAEDSRPVPRAVILHQHRRPATREQPGARSQAGRAGAPLGQRR